jgi:DNA-binding transcriptional LysR family regulator
MRSLNLDQLRALEAVVALASFTGAARQLNLSQSAISVQIRELEERFGIRLVERLGKKAYATAAGREVLEHARRISAETDAIATAMRRLRDGWIGRVHIGSTLTGLMYMLPPVLKKLHVAYPGIDLLMTNSPTSRMVEAVSSNEMDIGIVTLPVEDNRLAIRPLRAEPMVAILPATTRKVPKEITPDYVATQFLVLETGAVSDLVLRWLSADRARVPQGSTRVSEVEAVKVVVAAGLGMAIVPAMSVARPTEDIIIRPLDPPLPRTLALIHHRNKPEDDTAFRIVRDAIMELSNIPAAKERGKSRKKAQR